MASSQYANASGIYPHLALTADLGPPRSECGVGAMMAWAGKLWLVTYVSHKSASGVGTGLYTINERLELEQTSRQLRRHLYQSHGALGIQPDDHRALCC